MSARLLERAVDLLFPRRCYGCRSLGEPPWCGYCRRGAVPALECVVCGHSGEGALCSRHRAYIGADSVRAAYNYEGAVRALVRSFKYAGHRNLAPLLAEEIVPLVRDAALCDNRGPAVVIPVASEPLRRWRRGFNPPEDLARYAASRTGVDFQFQVLRRTRGGRAQAGLPAAVRRNNVQGRFSVKAEADLKGCSVILVDDVMTTGSTCRDAVRALKGAGASSVHVVVLASSFVNSR